MKRKKLFYFFIFLFFYFFTFSTLFSAPHISGKYIKGQPKDKVKILPDVSHLRQKGAPRKEIAKILGSIGLKKVAVIIVDFPDKQFSSGWHIQANETFKKLKEYYSEVSYGELQITTKFFYQNGSTEGELTGSEQPYRMPRSMGYYGKDTNETLAQLVKDAISATGGAVYKIFYDYVMVLHAGYGNESTNNEDDIWSVYIDWEGAVNGFTDGTIVPEKELNASPAGVTCHEFGHQLGLPDLYYNQESIVGSWCLMDYGCWLGSPQGSQPAHLSAWCKQFLGWVDVEVVSSTKKNVQLHYVESVSTAVIKIPIITADNPSKEYFLLEYRKKTNFDSDLPGSGLLVWKIDDAVASDPNRIKNNDINSGEPHYGVDLIEADRSSAGSNFGDSGDPFPGSQNVIDFFPQNYSITAYNGNPINVMLSNISLDTTYAYFDIISFSGLYAKVTRLNGYPLNNVRILLYKTDGSTYTYATTSVNGTAVVELSTGAWNVEYSLQNYVTYYETINVLPEQLIVSDVILRYDPTLVVEKNSFVIGNNFFNYTTMDKIVFRYNIEQPDEVKIIVYTLTGNIVKNFNIYHSQPGYYEQIWNVLDDNNNKLSPGVYFVVYRTKHSKKVEKFIVDR